MFGDMEYEVSNKDPFPWDDPALIYMGAVVLAGTVFLFAKEIFGFLGLL